VKLGMGCTPGWQPERPAAATLRHSGRDGKSHPSINLATGLNFELGNTERVFSKMTEQKAYAPPPVLIAWHPPHRDAITLKS
jgi:hypothetical protein